MASEEENEEEYPQMESGFDAILELKVGCNLPSLVTIYGLAALELPFRIIVPIMDDNICSDSEVTCGGNDPFQMSFAIGPLTLSFYIAAEVDVTHGVQDLIAEIEKCIGVADLSLNEASDAIDFATGPPPFLIAKFETLPLTVRMR